jgi:acetyl-CoA carboxylase alpha subunit
MAIVADPAGAAFGVEAAERPGQQAAAARSFERMMELSRSPAERDSYRRRLDLLRVS